MNEQKTAKTLPACPVETTLSLIGDKWKVLIASAISSGVSSGFLTSNGKYSNCTEAEMLPL